MSGYLAARSAFVGRRGILLPLPPALCAPADTLITPIDDNFVDFATLAQVDRENHAVIQPSICREISARHWMHGPKRTGFRAVKGFGERVIYREHYPQGLIVMNVREAGVAIQIAMSNIGRAPRCGR